MTPSNPILELEKATHDLNTRMSKRQQTVFGRYPFVFSLLGTFGAVSILYGFDALLDELPIMKELPFIPITVGILILIATGSLYKRLERKIDEA